MQINGKNILTLEQFGKIYNQRNPERVPVEQRVSFTRFPIFWFEFSRRALALWFIVIAASIMSVGHIVPAMKEFYDIEATLIPELIGLAGFVTMSFAVITFMSRPKRNRWAWLVIIMSMAAEIALNVFGSFLAAQNAEHALMIGEFINITTITSVIVGLLPPVVNMATGETLRQDLEEERAEEEKVRAANAAAQGKYQTMLEQNYVRYLKRQGVTDETKIYEIIAGIYEEDFDPISVERPEAPSLLAPEPKSLPATADNATEGDTERTPVVKSAKANGRAVELAEKLKIDGNERMTNAEIKDTYGISSPNVMSQARALLRSEGVLV